MSYEPITVGSYQTALAQLQRIFAQSSESITASEAVHHLARERVFNGKTLHNYCASELLAHIVNEPNGLVVNYPRFAREMYGYPAVALVRADEIRYIDAQNIVFVSLKDSEIRTIYPTTRYNLGISTVLPVETNNGYAASYDKPMRIQIVKPVYHWFTRTAFVTFTFTSGDVYQELYKEEYTDLPDLPAQQCGGLQQGDSLYKSFFHQFVHYGNLALESHSDFTAVRQLFAYPRMSEAVVECNTCHGSGKIADETCDTCKGACVISPHSPYKVYQQRESVSNIETIRDIAPVFQSI